MRINRAQEEEEEYSSKVCAHACQHISHFTPLFIWLIWRLCGFEVERKKTLPSAPCIIKSLLLFAFSLVWNLRLSICTQITHTHKPLKSTHASFMHTLQVPERLMRNTEIKAWSNLLLLTFMIERRRQRVSSSSVDLRKWKTKHEAEINRCFIAGWGWEGPHAGTSVNYGSAKQVKWRALSLNNLGCRWQYALWCIRVKHKGRKSLSFLLALSFPPPIYLTHACANAAHTFISKRDAMKLENTLALKQAAIYVRGCVVFLWHKAS